MFFERFGWNWKILLVKKSRRVKMVVWNASIGTLARRVKIAVSGSRVAILRKIDWRKR